MENFVFGTSSKANLAGVKNITAKLATLALKISEVDFGVTSGYRTIDEQYKIYLDGNSECDGTKVVSAHQDGLAVDVLVYIRDKFGKKLNGYDYATSNDVKLAYMEVGRAFLRAGRLMGIEVEWGLSYNVGAGHDVYHFQINL